MISNFTEPRPGSSPEKPAALGGVGLSVNEAGLYLALSDPSGVTEFWEVSHVDARNLAKMIIAVLD